MNEIFNIEPPQPPVAIVLGKWSYYGTPVSQLPEHERQLVFAVIRDAVNFDQDRTCSLKF